ncbi:MAG TPA: hypothetical protein VEA69_06240 [Tepidisphaeraceae bacterium]|nr:hypothetical protein [Tepidisphaeraceae bacterium]
MPSTPYFAAVGADGLRLLSPDGKTWSRETKGKEGEVYRAVAFGNGRCVAAGTFGGRNVIAATADATTWNAAGFDGKYRYKLLGLAHGQIANAPTFVGFGGDPVTVGQGSPFVVTSADGVKWSDQTPIAGKNILRRLAWGDGKFVGVGDRGRRSYSADAKDWKDAPSSKAIHTLVDVAFGGPAGKQLFVGVGLHGLRAVTIDGQNWLPPVLGEEGEHLNSVLWTGKRFVAIAAGATYTSPDGYAWTRNPNANPPLTACYGEVAGKPLYLGTAWKGRLLTSPDAITWTDVHRSTSAIEAVGYGMIG